MTDGKQEFVIGTRKSELARIQTDIVAGWIKEHYPEMELKIEAMSTTGDKILDRKLEEIGGKGLFVKELDLALLAKKTDLSVHSLKDMPMEVPDELPVIGYSHREDPRDVLVLPLAGGEQSEPGGSDNGKVLIDFSKPIGTSSKRRIIQLKKLFPMAHFESVRGNVRTRLRKLDEGQYGALILAAAGLKRLGLEGRISRYFETDEIIPSAGQGILSLQGRVGEDYSFLEGFFDKEAAMAASAERAFVRTLGGGCTAPVAAHAEFENNMMTLRGFFFNEDKGVEVTRMRQVSATTPEACEAAGIALAEEVLMECRKEGQMTGKVWLVGAGPGDRGLFTLKGLEVLQSADVVVYDALVGDAVLALVPETAKTINVGKRSGNHIMPQEEINQILLKEAEAGQRVVRLKGGDPFLFGRGGEELELLAQNGIPYEVVPGVTSAFAVPAYNGIPVTHRDFTSSVHIITGHKRKGQEYDIDFDALVRTRGTLIFLMGIAALEDIANGLLKAGMDPDKPAAVLERGTTAGQRRVVATVKALKEEAEKAQIGTPAIIVVGDVCRLAEDFAWCEKQPLFGKKILVTRPAGLNSEMAAKLRAQGAEVLELPAIRTEAIAPNEALDKCLAAFGAAREIARPAYDWLVLTSPTGARIFLEAFLKDHDIRELAGVRLAAIGEGSAKVLRTYGLRVDLIPSVYDGETLGKELAAKLMAEANEAGREVDARILIPRAAIGNRELVKELKKAGAEVFDIPTYETLYAATGLIDEKAEVADGRIDYAVFTSASTVRGFAGVMEDLDLSDVKAVCIGRQTKAAADALGMKTYMAKKATMDAVVEAVGEAAAQE